MSLRVIKLGGSLLDLAGLATRFDEWLAQQQPAANIMIVGGGQLADCIRAADRTHGLGEAASHALCLQVMGVTAALAQNIFATGSLCTSLAEIDRRPTAPLQILDVRTFLDTPWDSTACKLPESWQVTSDSIAAHVAGVLEACELVLLKSSLPAGDYAAQELAEMGFVDAHFPRVRGNVAVRIVNLREAEFPERAVLAGAYSNTERISR